MQNLVPIQKTTTVMKEVSDYKKKRKWGWKTKVVKKRVRAWVADFVLVKTMKKVKVEQTVKEPQAIPPAAEKEIRKRWRYKVLVGEGRPPYATGKKAWPLPRDGKPGRWHVPDSKELSMCNVGLHLTNAEYASSFARTHVHDESAIRLFAVEIHPDAQIMFDDPKVMRSSSKVVVSKARLVAELPLQGVLRRLQRSTNYKNRSWDAWGDSFLIAIKEFEEREAKAAETPPKAKAAQKKK